MKLQILSDLHLECSPFHIESGDADAVILAGDIAVGVEGVLWAKQTFTQPIIYVCGNHEYHDPDYSLAEHLSAMKCAAMGSNVMLLDNESVLIGDIRFLGSTMWSDLGNCRTVLPCDENIVSEHDAWHEERHFSVEQQQSLFERNREWLCSELAKPFAGKTVVVTHHAPSHRSLHPRHQHNPWNLCFMSNLESLMSDIDTWVHGHTHSSFNYRVGKCRVVCNPKGYTNHVGGHENPAFNPEMVIEV